VIDIRSLTLSDVRAVAPIPSEFATDRVYTLRRSGHDDDLSWTLHAEALKEPFRKRYDTGDPDEWLESYADTGPLAALSFDAATSDGTVLGLITYRLERWNNSIWLMDVRVRPAARRLGVGSALVRHLQDTARRKKVRGISVETQINNVPAIRFYRKHAFEIAGFNDHLYENDDLERQDVALFLFWETR
jgi:ribosomal protein S18 acetylase RimI-like enzyme